MTRQSIGIRTAIDSARYSYRGRSEVDQGFSASVYLDTDLRGLSRRVEVDVQQIVAEEDAGACPSNLGGADG